MNTEHVSIPPGMADTYALVLDHAIAKLSMSSGEKFTLAQLKNLRDELAGDRKPEAAFSDRDLNLLRSCDDWLESRSNAVAFKHNKGLMQQYAAGLRDIRRRLESLAAPKPVTLDELFGGKQP